VKSGADVQGWPHKRPQRIGVGRFDSQLGVGVLHGLHDPRSRVGQGSVEVEQDEFSRSHIAFFAVDAAA
jgi:hypothetical protein